MFHCPCKYCRDPRSKFNALRRNPEDLETLEKMAEARELYQETGNVSEVARRLGVGRIVIYSWLEGLDRDEVRQAQSKQAHNLYRQGYLKKEISQKLGIGLATIRRWLSQLEEPSWEEAIDDAISKGYTPHELGTLLCQRIKCNASSAAHWFNKRYKPKLWVQHAIVEFSKELSKKTIYEWQDALAKLFLTGLSKRKLSKILSKRCGISKNSILTNWLSDKRTPPIQLQRVMVEISEELQPLPPLPDAKIWKDAVSSLLKKGYSKLELARRLCKLIPCNSATAQYWFAGKKLPPIEARKAIIELNVVTQSKIKYVLPSSFNALRRRNPEGDCYRWAFNYVRKLDKPTVLLVHGTVHPDGWHRRYGHAWVEINGKNVRDWQTHCKDAPGGKSRAWSIPIKQFYAEMHPRDIKKYTFEEAMRGISTGLKLTGRLHFGPWHGVGSVAESSTDVEKRHLRRRNPYPLCSCGHPFGWEITGTSKGEPKIQMWNYTPCPNCGRKPIRMFPPPHKLEKDVPWEELSSIAISIGPPPTGHTFAKMLGALEIQYPGGGTEKPYCIQCNQFVEAKECSEHPGPENIEYRPYSFRRNPAQNVERRALRRWNPKTAKNPFTPPYQLQHPINDQIRALREHLGLTRAEFGALVADNLKDRIAGSKYIKDMAVGLARSPGRYIKRWEEGVLPGFLHYHFWVLKKIAEEHKFPFKIKLEPWSKSRKKHQLKKLWPHKEDMRGDFYEPLRGKTPKKKKKKKKKVTKKKTKKIKKKKVKTKRKTAFEEFLETEEINLLRRNPNAVRTLQKKITNSGRCQGWLKNPEKLCDICGETVWSSRRKRHAHCQRAGQRVRRGRPRGITERGAVRKEYTDEQKAEVLRLCAETELSYVEIAQRTGVERTIARNWCIKSGSRKSKKYSDEQKTEALRLCAETELSYAEIARRTGVKRNTVRDWCLEAGSRYITYYTDEQKTEVLRLCAETELSYREIGRQTGVGHETVRGWCLEAGSRYVTYYTDEQKAEVLRLCAETELSYTEIGERTGVAHPTVRNWCLKVENVEPKALRRRNPAKKLNSNVGVCVYGHEGHRGVILFDITKLRSEETIHESLLGYIFFGYEEDHLCPGDKYVAQKAVAQHGWGPATFEIAMQVTVSDGMEGLVPDRREITKDGMEIWRRFYLRDDIAKVPLKEGTLWGEEFLDQVYSLKTEMSFHSAKQRANKILKRIFPYSGEAETHLWEAAESWFSSEFQGGQYRPSSRRRRNPFRNPDDLETLAKVAEARKLYLEDTNILDIAAQLGIFREKLIPWIADLIEARIGQYRKRYSDKTIKFVEKLYQEGETYGNIAAATGVSTSILSAWVSEGLLGLSRKEKRKLKIVKARDLYQEGTYFLKDIARRVGIADTTLLDWEKKGWLGPFKESKQTRIKESMRKKKLLAAQLYQTGITSTIKLGQMVGVSQGAVHRWRETGLLGPPPEFTISVQPHPGSQDIRKEPARKLYLEGYTPSSIARKVKAGLPTVKKWLADLVEVREAQIKEWVQTWGKYLEVLLKKFRTKAEIINYISERCNVPQSTASSWVQQRYIPTIKHKSCLEELYQDFGGQPDIIQYTHGDPLHLEKLEAVRLIFEQEGDISLKKIAEQAGVAVNTLTAWEKKGLIPKITRIRNLGN